MKMKREPKTVSYTHLLTENGEVLLSFIDNGYVEFFMCIPYNIERKVQKESIEQY